MLTKAKGHNLDEAVLASPAGGAFRAPPDWLNWVQQLLLGVKTVGYVSV